jgi:hypothetical protein
MFLFGLFYFLSERKIGTRERIAFLNYYSSLISDINVDYRDKKISPENIRNISTSISNFTSQVEKLAPLAKNSERETQKWFIWLIDEFQKALSLWTERHADEILLYESNLENKNTWAIALLEKRLQIQSENMRKIIV